jgi:hypothetical protein
MAFQIKYGPALRDAYGELNQAQRAKDDRAAERARAKVAELMRDAPAAKLTADVMAMLTAAQRQKVREFGRSGGRQKTAADQKQLDTRMLRFAGCAEALVSPVRLAYPAESSRRYRTASRSYGWRHATNWLIDTAS